ncbi:CPBP family intramembrane glutamic endopeptidase [Iamia sp.]|uniref:CPBP family intramembrane glutamic endopeptidase n=1 Tax=Iamia sp. TaxID=2722710 RepID=UPI002CAAF55A|nr:CPBP family intramembrane glutamic endopeptidase [Iamia sp.]HXH56704.1 CPBP family intramembrane glutamic endopeptidase [Iamia sp.]
MLLAVGLLIAVAVWAFLFALPRHGLWTRTWIGAAVLSAFSVAALVATDRLDHVVGPLTPLEVGTGLGVGGAWLVATHIGHAVLCRLFPSFLAQINDLYAIRDRRHVASMVGAITAMGIAEELFFRGYVQDRVGLLVAIVAYTAVQLVERKWALMLAALLGGTIWGVLFWWREGLVAPTVAHVLWTAVLTFVWPLKGCDGPDHDEETVAEARHPLPTPTPTTTVQAPLGEEVP